MMRRKEVYTNITPIPSSVPRQLALDILHSHSEIITLNPLVLSHQPIRAPRNAVADEYYSTWYEITERVQYVPGLGKIGSGKISFKGCFHNVAWGLQTHMYAPMGIDLRSKWRIGGNQRDEPPEPQDKRADGAPQTGLYLREDIEIECNRTLISFVKGQLKVASKVLVDRLIKKAELLDAGVLQAMMEDGKLTTYNPADRSSRIGRELSLSSRRQSDQMSRSSSSRGPRSPTDSQLGPMSPGYAFPPQYGHQHSRSFAVELPGDSYHPQPAPGAYQELPDTSRYPKSSRLDKAHNELSVMEEAPEREDGLLYSPYKPKG
ncbi:hypothetical protein DTO013E5_1689 [Penicillium roqueforti]|uniref:Genomic scaffold, ProqFM164S03 n=1 Tax=Penicillium roqueforti (strain FM164) TaxID=1365484 RepID=W6QD14_PENRF|nr:uncharacterized protein LCP9604111_2701 [Penicillium roqueforti]CDM33956.1 unnamed protein product [Penicillium roqueforti FM164]KAF9251300.1 hypothetical protein LCP9604111_2701 [Penicillium roqueforti]KAI1837840.1 hypothetical protein CBS147337_1063 [Penicillium roqueforti]KAI2678530.1 hypothetical protein CBS147355_4415 [Penicillium roqueforti]KAI2689333.1 hypothetical protein LCP963914a_2422 [Penicillium roqueforti]